VRAGSPVLTILVVGGLVALGLWLFYFVGTENPHHADAIVVLAGNSKRPPKGLELLHRQVAPVLALSIPADPGPSVRKLCRRPHVTCFHAEPFSTRGEAETVARLAKRRGWNSLVVVSSRYHLRRAQMLFDRCTNADLQFVPAPTSAWDYLKNLPFEIGKLTVQTVWHRGC
jgi:DUF218 domain-containing protein